MATGIIRTSVEAEEMINIITLFYREALELPTLTKTQAVARLAQQEWIKNDLAAWVENRKKKGLRLEL